MTKIDTALWRDIMEYLRRKHAPICRQWFGDLEPLELDAGLLRVYTSNAVQQNYLQKKCLEPFTEAAQAVTGALIAVAFVTGDEAKATASHENHNSHNSALPPSTHHDNNRSAHKQPPAIHGSATHQVVRSWSAKPDETAPRSNGSNGGITSGNDLLKNGNGSHAAANHHAPGHSNQHNHGLNPNHSAPSMEIRSAGHATENHGETFKGSGASGGSGGNGTHFSATSSIHNETKIVGHTGGASNGITGTISGTASGGSGGQRTASISMPVSSTTMSMELQLEQIVICPDYSFENFVTGPNNRLAYAASVAVANQPGVAYNPLFIHGGVGLGKTHLLQAICQQIMQRQPKTRICYLSCDSFMNQFLDCVQQGKMAEFRHRYRHVDLLVIDDIHFLANKERSQEEFFHTFNELYQSNRQIVLSSDSPPNEIPQLEERLVSRFQWGLVANVSKPDLETRIAILRAKAKLRGIELPDDVIAHIAAHVDNNARELEGALTTIQGHAALENRPINLALAQLALGQSTPLGGASQATLQNIIDAVTSYYSVKLSDLQSKRRHKSITEPRQVCMWLARKRTRFSLEEIGGYFGGRDHTTVMHSISITTERMNADVHYARQIQQIEERISQSH